MQLHFRWLALSALVAGYGPTGAIAAQSTLSGPTAVSISGIDPASPSSLAPFRAGDWFFNIDEAGALHVRNGERGAPRPLLPAASFGVLAPSPNGKYIAYTVGPAHPGSSDVRIRDVLTGQDLPDVLHDALISPAPWSHDNKGFLYVRQDSTDGRQRVYYHGLGRPPEKDALILSQFDHPEWRYSARVSDDGNYAVFTISYPADSHTRIYFIDLANPGKPNFGAPVVKLTQAFDARYEFVDNAGDYFFLKTDRAAPLGRILLANTSVIRETRWPSLIPETSDSLLFARTAGDEFLIAVYRTDSGATVGRIFGPEDPSVLRQEIRERVDSLKKDREKNKDDRPVRPVGSRGFMGNGPAIRLQPRADIAIPAGASIVAMNSVADQEQLFYTVKLSDGTTQSFVYNVKDARGAPYPANPE
jgi:hypothetical protein